MGVVLPIFLGLQMGAVLPIFLGLQMGTVLPIFLGLQIGAMLPIWGGMSTAKPHVVLPLPHSVRPTRLRHSRSRPYLRLHQLAATTRGRRRHCS